MSWQVSNIVAPLTLSVAATMGVLQVGQSKDWIYHPWTYAMTALNASEQAIRVQAIELALGIGLVLAIISILRVKFYRQEFR
jgi:hypothetical protein